MVCRYVAGGVELGRSLDEPPWSEAPAYGPFRLYNGSANSAFATEVRTLWDGRRLYVAFRCEDQDILATMTERDSPLYDEEVVEVFIAPRDLHNYFEFNVSPRGVVFDSLIHHDGVRFVGHPSWNCAGLEVVTERAVAPGQPTADAPPRVSVRGRRSSRFPSVPLEELTPRHGTVGHQLLPDQRRPVEEYSCWSPTLLEPAHLHVPSRFGTLRFVRE